MLASTLAKEARQRSRDSELIPKEKAALGLGIRPTTLDAKMQSRGMHYQFRDSENGREAFVSVRQLKALQGQSPDQRLFWDSSDVQPAQIKKPETANVILDPLPIESRYMHRAMGEQATDAKDSRQACDPYLAALKAALGELKNARISTVHALALVCRDPGRATQADRERLGAAMCALGWRKGKMRFGKGAWKWGYAIGDALQRISVAGTATREPATREPDLVLLTPSSVVRHKPAMEQELLSDDLMPVVKAAELLGVRRQTLDQKLRRRGLDPVRRVVRGRVLLYLKLEWLDSLRQPLEMPWKTLKNATWSYWPKVQKEMGK